MPINKIKFNFKLDIIDKNNKLVYSLGDDNIIFHDSVEIKKLSTNDDFLHMQLKIKDYDSKAEIELKNGK